MKKSILKILLFLIVLTLGSCSQIERIQQKITTKKTEIQNEKIIRNIQENEKKQVKTNN
jgi:hypothetical protein